MLGDKNLDSEEYAMLSTGVYPQIFHSFRKKAFLIKLLSYYMVNTDHMMNYGYHWLKKLMLNYMDHMLL